MATQLPSFTRRGDARCSKCLCSEVSAEYRADLPQLHFVADELHLTTALDATGECLLRRCLSCGWGWLEACADAGAP